MKIVDLPDGTQGEFPDDMDDAAIEGVLQKQFGAPKEASKGLTMDDRLAAAKGTLTDPSFYKKGLVDVPRDAVVGLVKSGADAGAQVLDALPGGKILKMALKTKGLTPVEDAQAAAKKMYDNAGPMAGVTKTVGDAGLTSTPGTGLLAVAGTGALGGAALPPGEGESRLGNAVQGGLTALGLGSAVKLGGQAVKGIRQVMADPLTRAEQMFSKDLGKGRMGKVENNLDLPQEVPMSTAAATGSDELAGFEKTARADKQGAEGAKWASLDSRTKNVAWNKVKEGLQDSVDQYGARFLDQKTAFAPTQQALDKIKFPKAESDMLELSIEQLKRKPDFQGHTVGQQELNRIMAEVTSPGMTLGGLANMDTRLGNEGYRLEPRQADQVRQIVRAKIDSMTGGAMSKAHADLAATREPLERSETAQNIMGANVGEISGVPKGKSVSGAPELTSTKLGGQVNRFGETVEDGFARDRMDPNDRQSVQNVVDALRKAEHPTQSPVAAKEMPGLSAPDVPNPSSRGVLRWVGEKMLGSRNEQTRKAAGLALRSTSGWRKMLDAAEKSKDISASDAEMLAAILRKTGGGSAAAVTGDQ